MVYTSGLNDLDNTPGRKVPLNRRRLRSLFALDLLTGLAYCGIDLFDEFLFAHIPQDRFNFPDSHPAPRLCY